jgi:hypothetical protein
MKLTWHIVKKDFRRFWVGALLLVGLTTLKLLLLNPVFYNSFGGEWRDRLPLYQGLLLAAEVVLSFFLAVAVMQEDPVTETGALWQTLPITRWQLLGAKLLSVILISVFPPMLTLAVGWFMFGLPAGLVGWPLAIVAEAQLGLCLLALAFGSLTKNTAHLLFWIVGGLVAFGLSQVLVDPFLHKQPLEIPGVRFTHLFLTIFIGSLAGVAITLNQYLGRSKNRSFAFLAVGWLLCFYVTETVRTRHGLDFTSTILPAQHDLDQQIARLRVNVVQGEIAEAKPDADATVMLHLSVDDADPWQMISPVGSVVGHWTPVETNHFAFPAGAPVFFRPYLARENRIKLALEGAFEFSSSPAVNNLSFGAETRIGRTFVGGLKNQSTPFQGQIGLTVRESRVDGQMALVNGSTLHSDYGTTRITSVDSDGTSLSVEIEVQAALARDPGWFVGIDALAVPLCTINYALVNTRTRTILTQSPSSIGRTGYAYGIERAHAKLQFILPQSDSRDANSADWILVEIRAGDVHRAIKSFQENVFLKEVPMIERDPNWIE